MVIPTVAPYADFQDPSHYPGEVTRQHEGVNAFEKRAPDISVHLCPRPRLVLSGWGSGMRIQGSGFEVWGWEFRV